MQATTEQESRLYVEIFPPRRKVCLREVSNMSSRNGVPAVDQCLDGGFQFAIVHRDPLGLRSIEKAE